MTTFTGGTRARLIKDNLYQFVNAGLDDLGWLTSSSNRLDVTMLTGANPWDEEVQPNCVVVSTEGVTDNPAEIGSELANHTWEYFIDIIGENDSIALHLATDVRDLIEGRLTGITAIGPIVSVYDLTSTSATPIEAFTVEIIDVSMDKGRMANSNLKRYWWQIGFTVVDVYE